MKALLLCNYDLSGAAMVPEHINSIIRHSEFDVYVYEDLVKNGGEIDLAVDINVFDIIIIHYSIFLAVSAYCSTRTKAQIRAARGLKVAFLQDEYRFVDRSIEAMHEAGIDLVYSCVPEVSIPFVYPPEKMKDIKVINTLTGFVSDYLSVLPPKELRKRRYAVSYRGRRYPDWHGAMGREKYEIAEKFKKRARRIGLSTNISCSERDRLYGAKWVDLIRNSRAVLGVESGASVFDFSGDISSRSETVRLLMGRKGVSYEELRDRYFADVEGRIDLAQISPRILEAISLRTLCILFEGRYSGILKPNIHYLPLKKDFSNFAEVAKRVKDHKYVSEITANAYSDISMNPNLSYVAFVRKFDKELLAAFERKYPGAKDKYASEAMEAYLPAEPDKHGTGSVTESTFGKSHLEYRRTLRFRAIYDEAHPFTQFRYPHSVPSVSGSMTYKAVQAIKKRLPYRAREALRSLVR